MTVVDLYDPDLYVAGPPHELFAQLRRTQPVYFQEMSGEPGYWMVLKHADLVHVAREPQLFSASEGGVMLENLAPEQFRNKRLYKNAELRMLIYDFGKGTTEADDERLAVAPPELRQTSEIAHDLERHLRALLKRQSPHRRKMGSGQLPAHFAQSVVQLLLAQV